MRHMGAGKVMMLAGVFLLPGAALAQTVIQQRCAYDNLDFIQAEARLEWARRCALAKTPTSVPFDTGVPASNGGTLKEYVETGSGDPAGPNMYTSSGDAFEINNSYINKLFNSGATTQTTDAQGFFKWSRALSRKKLRPLYPIFGSLYDINSTNNRQLYPHPSLATCDFYYNRNGTQQALGQTFFVNGFCESVGPTVLTSGVPVGSLSGGAGSSVYYALNVPADANNVVFETNGGSGDVDLHVRYGSAPDTKTYDCRPFLGANYEGCNMRSPGAGYWHVMLNTSTSYAGVTLKGIVYTRLVDGVASALASGAQSSEQFWAIDVPAGMSRLNINLAGPAGATGDADLYVRYGMGPTGALFDCRPYMDGNSEVCSFNNPQEGTWYVMLRGWTTYSGVTVTADHY